ncbi:MAG: hypothetical protein DWP95_04705 [Proteobacteria bacterium]|nr:MAG: hypothetical protein DWP95_04705 [Pseudomonadota bacterium]
MMTSQKHSIATRLIAVIAIVFGLMTIREGGMVLYGNEAALTAAGDYVPFVLWFNFMAGFFYVISGVGLWLQRRWAVWLAVVIAITTALMFVAFGLHVAFGGAFAKRTVVAMSLRTGVWTAIAFFGHKQISNSDIVKESP